MSFTDDNQLWCIPLSRYERDNLLALLSLLSLSPPDGSFNPFSVANTGDWVWQIRTRIRDKAGFTSLSMGDKPNVDPETMLANAKRSIAEEHKRNQARQVDVKPWKYCPECGYYAQLANEGVDKDPVANAG